MLPTKTMNPASSFLLMHIDLVRLYVNPSLNPPVPCGRHSIAVRQTPLEKRTQWKSKAMLDRRRRNFAHFRPLLRYIKPDWVGVSIFIAMMKKLEGDPVVVDHKAKHSNIVPRKFSAGAGSIFSLQYGWISINLLSTQDSASSSNRPQILLHACSIASMTSQNVDLLYQSCHN